jgi:putative membrane protein
MMGWYGGEMSPVSGIAVVVFWLAVLGLIVWLVGRLLPGVSGKTTGPPSESELEVLDRQLASGEIEMHAWQDQRGAFLAAQTNPKKSTR